MNNMLFIQGELVTSQLSMTPYHVSHSSLFSSGTILAGVEGVVSRLFSNQPFIVCHTSCKQFLTPMIHIEQTSLSEHDIMIKVGGVLDLDAIEVLKDVCNANLARGNRVTVDFNSVLHITREGRSFVQDIMTKVSVLRLPEFMTIDIDG